MTSPDTATRPARSEGFATLDEIDARREVRRLLERALEATDDWEPWNVEDVLADAAKVNGAWRYIACRREALVR